MHIYFKLITSVFVALVVCGAIFNYLSPDEGIAEKAVSNVLKRSAATESILTSHADSTNNEPINNEPTNSVVVWADEEAVSMLGYESQYGKLPQSLRGTILRVRFEVDAEGDLVVTPGIREVFEYFFSTIGEESSTQIIKRIEEYISVYLDGDARQQCLVVLEQYVEMKIALQASESVFAVQNKLAVGIEGLVGALVERRQLRQSTLDAEIYDVFYARDDDFDDAVVARLGILDADDLSDEEKAIQIAALEESLPASVRKSRADTHRHTLLQAKTQLLRHSGATNEEVFQLRVDEVGVAAAERLRVLDEKRKAWVKRLSDYSRQRDEIIFHEGLSDEDERQQVLGLQTRLFSKQELNRVRALGLL